MKKRLLSIVTAAALVLTVLCSVVGTVSAAEGDPAGVNFTVSTVLRSAFPSSSRQGPEIIEAGQDVTVYVNMSGTDKAAALQVKLKYDGNLLTPKSGVEQGALYNMGDDQGFKTVNLEPVGVENEVWITGMSVNNQEATSGGAIAKITFTAQQPITTDSPISVYYGKVCIVNTNEDGTVSVESLPEGNYTPGGVVFKGDVDKSGDVNINDAFLTAREYVSQNVLDQQAKEQADLDGNGVDINDAFNIARFYVQS